MTRWTEEADVSDRAGDSGGSGQILSLTTPEVSWPLFSSVDDVALADDDDDGATFGLFTLETCSHMARVNSSLNPG